VFQEAEVCKVNVINTAIYKNEISTRAYVQWNLDFTFFESSFSLFYMYFHWSYQISVRTVLYCPRICVCAFYPVSRLNIWIKRKVAGCCCFFSTFNWK
jgi:ABC-type maltose transport system permease subunit